MPSHQADMVNLQLLLNITLSLPTTKDIYQSLSLSAVCQKLYWEVKEAILAVKEV